MKAPLLLLALAITAHAADFPTPYNTEPDQSGPMPAAEAAAKLTLPPGFQATVFAAEPQVQNPIAMSWDGRGQLWIAENYTYAEAGVRYDLKLRDRILIFADTNGDGVADERRVFADDLQLLTSIAVTPAGVWALTLPSLIFIPDANRDGVPDGPAQVVLDGFIPPLESYHNVANGLRFGPDGWLYGRCGASGPCEIGAPGAPAAERISVRGGMWRYHPQRRVFEAITSGNTNPWGHDWDADGELFYVNTVNGHLWHAVAGAHFVRAHTLDPNPRAYALIDQHADHWHFDTGKSWQDSRAGAANALGGGHSHIGAMIYLGDHLPAEYRGRLWTLNQHGKRANQELLERTGSGYVARHGTDTLIAADPWFVGLDLAYGPDGGVFVLDWSDTGECHERNGVHRTSGRIFKITSGKPAAVAPFDLAQKSDAELVQLHTHANEWFSRRARLELGARADAGQDLTAARTQLRALLAEGNLRAFWTLQRIGGVDDALLKEQLASANEHVRAWAVRFISDAWPLDTLLSQRPAWQPGFTAGETAARRWLEDLQRLGRNEPSGLVRLALASALQRVPVAFRAPIAAELAAHAEDATDHNLPLLLWYALIPVADADPLALIPVASRCALPQTRQFIARRLAEDLDQNPAPLNALLAAALADESASFATDAVAGLSQALAGWRKAPKPAAWEALVERLHSADASVTARLRELNIVFGDGRALDELVAMALDKKADLKPRQAALRSLIENRAPTLRAICEKLLSERFMNPIAARGLATFNDPAIGEKLVKAWGSFHATERAQLIDAIVSRPAFVRPLLDAIAAGKIPRTALTPFQVRQIRGFNDETVSQQLTEVWGETRESTADKKQLLAKLKTQLTPDVLAAANKGAGRQVFTQTCAVCHRLYGEGGEVGPDLTGSGRSNLDYLLENIVDPSAVVNADYRMTILTLKDGRVLNGFLTAKTDRTLTVRTMTEKLTLERSEVSALQELPQSMMPEGLLLALNETQVRDLLAYLMHPAQVPLPQ